MLPLPQENTPSSWASSRIKHEIQPFCLGSKPLPYLLQNRIKVMFISSKSLETNKKSNLFGIKFCRRESSSFDRLAHFKMCFFAKSFPIMFSVIVKQISVQRVQFIDRPLFVSIGLINAILKGLISPARRGAYSPTLLHSPPHTPSGNYCITGLSIIVTFRPTAFCHGYTDASRKAG